MTQDNGGCSLPVVVANIKTYTNITIKPTKQKCLKAYNTHIPIVYLIELVWLEDIEILLFSNSDHQVWISDHVEVLTQILVRHYVGHELLQGHAIRVTEAPTEGEGEIPKMLDLRL